MTSYSYEIALCGNFLKGDLNLVLNGIALPSESAHQMHLYGVVFDLQISRLSGRLTRGPLY
ncbi:hypothetical protein EI94DRAFT_1716002 [Lactarius quietus]|nr:hypothetical protein EI94DRAFT_1716002 [Lactarius quietus]